MTTLINKLRAVITALQKYPDCRPISVGGSVRDAIRRNGKHDILTGFEKNTKDFDLEVFGASPDTVLMLLARSDIEVELVGRSFPVFKVKGFNIDISFPRTEVKTGEKHTDFAIEVAPYISFAEAALRRDFTINAIGYDWNTDSVLDPYNGITDIIHAILRPVSEKFKEDALRVLRCFKFIGRFGCKPDSQTIEYCRTMIPELVKYPRERILPEWNDFMLNGHGYNIPSAFLFLADCGGMKELYPEIYNIAGIEQHPEHHPEGDVLTHTVHCLKYYMDHVRDRLIDDTERLIVGYAVLTHDFGKATETRIENGKLIAHGHEDSPLARHFLSKLFDPAEKIVSDIEKLVKAHMRPVILYKDMAGMPAIRRLNVAVEGRIDRLMTLVECDQGGRPPKPVNKEAINWVLEKTNQLNIETTSLIKPIILGRHLIKHLELNPSPLFKTIIDEMFEAQLDGKFVDETTGIDYLLSHYRV